MPLDPFAQQINDLVAGARSGGDPGDPSVLRQQWRDMLLLLPTTTRQCTSTTHLIAGVPCLVVAPPAPSGAVLVWFHGGGWVLGAPELSIAEVDQLAADLSCHVVSVDYRLAPEHCFPAAYDDAVAVASALVSGDGGFTYDRERVAVGGDSAGGNLAAAVAQHLGSQLRAQLLVYPATDLARQSPAAVEYADGYLLSSPMMSWFAHQYVGDGDYTDPRCSPLRADRAVLANCPPAHVVVAEFDPLRDDGFDYAQALRDAGVTVSVDHREDMMHGFFGLAAVVPAAADAVRAAAAAIAAFF